VLRNTSLTKLWKR